MLSDQKYFLIEQGRDGYDYSVTYPSGDDFLFSSDKGFYSNGSTNYYYTHE